MIKLPAHALRTAVDRVKHAVQDKATLPILQHLVMQVDGNDLLVTGTDLELQISTRVPLDISSSDAIGAEPSLGGHTMPGKKLRDIARALDPDEIVALEESSAGLITLRAGRSRYRLHSLPGADYPRMEAPAYRETPCAHFSPAALGYILRNTAPAIAKDDVRYYLNGLFLSASDGAAINVVGTDGHRLNHLRAKIDGERLQLDQGAMETDAIIPGATISALQNLIEHQDEDERIIVNVSDRTFTALVGDTTLHSKLIDGRYPDWRRVIPTQHAHHVQLPREPLLNAMAQTVVISDEKIRGVRLIFSADHVDIESSNAIREEANNSIRYTTCCETLVNSDTVAIGFNHAFIESALKCINTDDIIMRITDSDKSAILTPTNADDTYVVMPMRI